MRLILHYLITTFIIGLYGGQVCPFLESLSIFQLLTPLVISLFAVWIVRHPLRAQIIDKAAYQHQTFLVFWFEFLLMVAIGVFLMIFNHLVYEFPFDSGVKLVLAVTTIGFFLAIDMALSHERHLTKLFCHENIDLDPEHRYFPLPKKLAVFAAACSIFAAGIIFLVINKDLEWLVSVGDQIDLAEAQHIILGELGFVFIVILGYVMNLLFSFTRNLHTFFNNENSVLKKATGGNLDGYVPVSTNDEFGVMAKHTNLMIAGLKEKTEELSLTRDVTIMSLASLAETRDNETGAHLLRTQRYVRHLAEYLANKAEYSAFLDGETIDLLFKSAPLHDIGKVGIPDHILLKPGKLTTEEFHIMKTHATLGGDALKGAEESLGSNFFLRIAREIAYGHHEKWDGSGYPKGLKGEEIPLSGRIMALADVYDALISKRVYKKAFSHDKAKEIILQGSNSHFDPVLVETFLAIEEKFIETAKEYSDPNAQAEN
jgi:HD-GYP domain-containing protein (c-di-GMP phosphodiesterase class II)